MPLRNLHISATGKLFFALMVAAAVGALGVSISLSSTLIPPLASAPLASRSELALQ